MRLLYVIQCLNHGGMETSLFNILEHLSCFHDILVCSLHEPTASRKRQLQRLGVSYLSLGYGRSRGFSSLYRLNKTVENFSPHAIFAVGHSFAVTLGLAFVRNPAIYKEHNIHFHHRGVRPYFFWFIYYLLSCNVYNSLTFPSDPNRLEASSYIFSKYRYKLYTQYNIVKIPARLAGYSSSTVPASRPSQFRFGFAGWLIHRKRPDLFLDFAIRIHNIYPDAKFIIAGDGPLLVSLVNQVTALGLSEKFQFLGVVSNIEDFFDQIDYLCFFSDADAAALVPFEAFAHLKLVISSTKRYGLQDYLLDGVNCINSTDHSISELVDKFLNYSSVHHSLVESGFHMTRSTFGPAAFFNSLSSRSALPVSYHDPLRP